MAKSIDPLLQTRASLLIRLRDLDDQTSWQTFFDGYRNLIYGVARKAGLTHAEAEDVLQETVVSVAKHIRDFRYDPAKGSFKGWLLLNVRRRAIGQFRKRIPTASGVRAGEDAARSTAIVEKVVDPKSQEFDGLWELEWQKTLLEAATAKIRRQLDPQKYQIFDFCVNQEWPPARVAQSFGVSVGQVYVIKHRVTEMLKEEVGRLEKQPI